VRGVVEKWGMDTVLEASRRALGYPVWLIHTHKEAETILTWIEAKGK